MQVTEEVIRRIAPQARFDYVAAFVEGGDTLKQWGFDKPIRFAALIANACAETGGLRIVSENMNYSAPRIKAVWPTRPEAVQFAGNPRLLANSVYGARMGNDDNGTNDDDGFNYRGRGLGQTTGKFNYREIGRKIGYDLVANPELLDDANISLKALCAELSQFHQYCDKGEKGFRAVCNGLNRGNALSRLDPIGWADRQVWYSRACSVLKISARVDDGLLSVGDHGALVTALQERLKGLGYAVGRADGIFGSRTRAAVLAFQAENSLKTDGIVGPKTQEALNAETVVPMPLGERATETKDDLKAAGSTTIAATDKIKSVAQTAVIASTAAGGAKEVGLLDGAGDLLKELTTLKTTTNGFVDIFQWALSHWYLFVVLGGFMAWKWAKDIEFRRVLEHNLGINLSR